MKTFVAAALLSLASIATAQLENIPQCALSCLLTPLQSDGCSELTDFKCHCAKADSLFASVLPCAQKACGAEDQAAAISAVEGTCAQAGVTVEVPSVSSTDAASSTAAESSAEATTTVVSTTEVASSSAAESTALSSETPSSSVSASPTPSANGTSPTSAPSPSVSEFPGAAARVTQAAGALGAAAIALLVL